MRIPVAGGYCTAMSNFVKQSSDMTIFFVVMKYKLPCVYSFWNLCLCSWCRYPTLFNSDAVKPNERVAYLHSPLTCPPPSAEIAYKRSLRIGCDVLPTSWILSYTLSSILSIGVVGRCYITACEFCELRCSCTPHKHKNKIHMSIHCYQLKDAVGKI